jgi:hypothetical protein
MNFIKELQSVLLLGLETNVDAESINLENKLKADPSNITLKELTKQF